MTLGFFCLLCDWGEMNFWLLSVVKKLLSLSSLGIDYALCDRDRLDIVCVGSSGVLRKSNIGLLLVIRMTDNKIMAMCDCLKCLRG